MNLVWVRVDSPRASVVVPVTAFDANLRADLPPRDLHQPQVPEPSHARTTFTSSEPSYHGLEFHGRELGLRNCIDRPMSSARAEEEELRRHATKTHTIHLIVTVAATKDARSCTTWSFCLSSGVGVYLYSRTVVGALRRSTPGDALNLRVSKPYTSPIHGTFSRFYYAGLAYSAVTLD